jgi:hypothetical protein
MEHSPFIYDPKDGNIYILNNKDKDSQISLIKLYNPLNSNILFKIVN